MPIYTDQPDPSWPESVGRREAILWVGSSAPATPEDLKPLLALPWRAVYIDGASAIDTEVVEGLELGDLRPRFYSADEGPKTVPPNRVPFYDLRGPAGDVTWDGTGDAPGLLRRMSMLNRWPAARWVFCVGVESEGDWMALSNAQSLSDAFRNLIVVSPSGGWHDGLDANTDSAFVWIADAGALGDLLSRVRYPDLTEGSTVSVRTQDGGITTVDLGRAIDQSSPILADFEFIPSSVTLRQAKPTEDLLRVLLTDPSGSWEPYAAGVAFPRWESIVETLRRYLPAFVEDGPGASMTAWIDAEPASGATTALRHVGLELARQGFPVLVARPRGQPPEFSRLKAFLQAGSDRLAEEGVSVPEVPWILLFDVEHVQVHWDVVRGMASGLKKLQRSVVVVAVRPTDSKPPEGEYRALGRNADLGPALTSTVSEGEALSLGEHFGRFLPPSVSRSRSEWLTFLEDTVRTTPEGRKSLFWLALRFWLFLLPGSGRSIRDWIAAKANDLTAGSPEVTAGLLEICALARYRLLAPSEILHVEAARALRRVGWDRSNPLGIVVEDIGHADGLTVLHPLIGEELLRLTLERPEYLAAVEKESCVGLLDLELHLLARIMRRPAIASPVGSILAEKLVTTGLRVDPRDSPRNYQVRDRIVAILEKAPDSLWDKSQVFNHHLARARRYLAVAPPSEAWTETQRREQFELSENHLLDAIEYVRPDDPEREESPLNLRVSLALTLDYRSRFESEMGHLELAEQYRRRADVAFQDAQALDADNSYVLENYARFKLREAELLASGQRKTRLVVEAVTLLELELHALDSTHRDEAILSELARAYEMLEKGEGLKLLRRRADRGEEAAVVALAKLALYHASDEDREARLIEARELLEGLPYPERGWLGLLSLYRVVTELEPLNFARRLDVLQELDGISGVPWPLQLRLEFGILLFQAGDETTRRHGKDVFTDVRDQMGARTATLRVPPELKFLMDPASDFQKPLEMSIRIKDTSSAGRNVWAVPEGWYNVDVPLRPFMFGGRLREGDERDCLIQFTNFGPQAVPPTTLS